MKKSNLVLLASVVLLLFATPSIVWASHDSIGIHGFITYIGVAIFAGLIIVAIARFLTRN